MVARDFANSDSHGLASTGPPSGTSPVVGKHRRIYELLGEDILSGKYLFGDRVSRETSLVKQFDVSRPTAARALKDWESKGLVERRHGAGTGP